MQFFTLATLKTSGGPKATIGVENHFYRISDLQPKLHVTLKDLLANWPTSFSMLEQLAASIIGGEFKNGTAVPEEKADLATPVLYPNKLMAVGANFTGHLQEMGLPTEKWHPMPFFLRPPTTTLMGPGRTVHIPKSTKQFDWECELAVIVGKRLRNAGREEAMEAVAGYAIPTGLALAACRQGKKVRFFGVAGLVNDLLAAKDGLRLSKFINHSRNLTWWYWMNWVSFPFQKREGKCCFNSALNSTNGYLSLSLRICVLLTGMAFLGMKL